MNNPHFIEAKLHTHFVDEHKQDIEENMKQVVIADKQKEARLKSTFLPSKKIAAVSGAVSNYMAHTIAQKEKK